MSKTDPDLIVDLCQRAPLSPQSVLWQGGSSEGSDMREGLCSKLNTDSGERAGGGSFQGNKVCVCSVWVCAWTSGALWPQMAPSESHGENLSAIYSMICYLGAQSHTSMFTSIRATTFDQALLCLLPGHTNTLSTRTILVPWSPLEPRILKHSSIWFIIKEYEVYDELSLFYILQWMKKKVETNS